MNKKCCDKETVCTVVGQDVPPVDLCLVHSEEYEKKIAASWQHKAALVNLGIDVN